MSAEIISGSPNRVAKESVIFDDEGFIEVLSWNEVVEVYSRTLEFNVRVQQNALISTLKDRSGLARILLQRLVALVRRAALSVSSYGG